MQVSKERICWISTSFSLNQFQHMVVVLVTFWHRNIAAKTKFKVIQSTCFQIILGNDYTTYDSALNLCSLNTIYQRRGKRFLNFAVKCVNDKFSTHIFPVNTNPYHRKMFQVNFARTNRYFKSTMPQCQRLLNEYARDNPNFIPA